ncbi:rod shape-determining protein RodA [Paenibacillus sp. IB182496]|uniref:Rod shape-determining protein RodA n=1 Tax=Paenibacillus sabuli TaxID=2772509 RepID=A0A927BQW1_9BACL|nr:FtsW/RodA/SpoVE family cell cycle protein [Paenibacillus sabuli]MBD2844612.1 rod shape-determining protein RodA [Paenibacillus sabuli]
MLNKLKKLDWGILLLMGVLMVISTFVVRSATIGQGPAYENYDVKTMVFYGAGFLVMIACVFFDYRILLKTWMYLYGLGLLMLVGLLFFGVTINGATSWYRITDSLMFQPAELEKIFLIITLAAVIGRRQGEPLSFKTDVLLIAVLSFVPFLLVMAQPDLGNAIIYLFIVLGMLWIGNVRYLHVLIGLAAIIGVLVLSVTLFNTYSTEIKDYLEDQGKGHWHTRINTFINPEMATADEKHQSEKSMIAIGSGGLTGDGYLQGDSKNRKFIPYPYSDSIFVVIGEEFGFQGSAVLLLVYFLLVYRMIIIAFQCYDIRASYIIIGIASMFVFQIFQNIGMMIGIMPITGITLPFVSYGGTSLMLNMLSIGIVLSIRAHQYEHMSEDE